MTTKGMSDRGRFSGATQILRYNWPKYLASIVVILIGVAILSLVPLPTWIVRVIGAALGLSLFWLIASLAVSHWVYDRSALYSYDWLERCLPSGAGRWISIHAGLDETPKLKEAIGNAPLGIIDIYDPELMSEPSIARARRTASQDPRTVRSAHSDIPGQPGATDTVFLIFVAHELRTPQTRRALFAELRRVLTDQGSVVIVEHVRDFWNWSVFGPGALHFWPRSCWISDLESQGLRMRKEFKITPFVTVMAAEPAS